MAYKVVLTSGAKEELKRLDKPTSALMIGWLEKNIDNSENPKNCGNEMSNMSERWKYCIGDDRIICEIIEKKIVVLTLRVGHTKEV